MTIHPIDPSSFHHSTATLSNGKTFHWVDEMPSNYERNVTRTLILIHGFPALWYEWRWQIPAWVAKGWRVIAMDMIGYGLSDKPRDLQHYTPSSCAADVVALLDHLQLDRVTVVGHDWGAYIAWRMGIEHRNRLDALIPISVMYNPPAPTYYPVDQLARWYPGIFGYWQYFCSPEAEIEIQSNLSNLFDVYYRSLAERSSQPLRGTGEMRAGVTGRRVISTPADLMTAEEKSVYIEALEKFGIAAPLRYYKSHRERWDQEKEAEKVHSPYFSKSLPVLFIAPTGDQFASEPFLSRSKPFIPNLEIAPITSGHFVLLEKRHEISQIVGDWLDKLNGKIVEGGAGLPTFVPSTGVEAANQRETAILTPVQF
ncbi:hypothetical protein FRB95_005465 [Tulasnella sp. JGI-2019a]|nr:hypothetical protein FRB95_005465 [Tulasnella sp. JGI-2019a]